MSELNKPNIGADLIRIPSVITRALDVAIEHSQSFAQEGYPDASTQEGFVSYVQTFVSVLHAHHLTEDDLVFPYFRDKLPDAPFDLLMAQHREMQLVLDEIKAAIEKVAADVQVGESLNDLNRALTKMAEIWRPHIQGEEDRLSVEKADALLDIEEHIRLGRTFAQHSQEPSGPDFLVAPFILYNLPPEERAIMSQAMPPIVTQQLVPVAGKRNGSPCYRFYSINQQVVFLR
jgi:hemerythrin-like domain-containing protein